jgi:hypothetical protein
MYLVCKMPSTIWLATRNYSMGSIHYRLAAQAMDNLLVTLSPSLPPTCQWLVVQVMTIILYDTGRPAAITAFATRLGNSFLILGAFPVRLVGEKLLLFLLFYMLRESRRKVIVTDHILQFLHASYKYPRFLIRSGSKALRYGRGNLGGCRRPQCSHRVQPGQGSIPERCT